MRVNNHKVDLLLAQRCMSLNDLRSKGLSPKTLTKIRRGEEVKPKTIGHLAKALGAPVEDIIREEA